MTGNVYQNNNIVQIKVFQIPETIKIESINKIVLFLNKGDYTNPFSITVSNLSIRGAQKPSSAETELNVISSSEGFIFKESKDTPLKFYP